nr:MAG TPA: hypothetical protein [Inoviridae sp.]
MLSLLASLKSLYDDYRASFRVPARPTYDVYRTLDAGCYRKRRLFVV